MSPQLTVHNAQISTATVEIKTLTITGKQVTLAVFRQLVEEPLIADEGTLNGVPWGRVNYHPGKQCRAVPHVGEQRDYDYTGYEHLHVVWQKGSELRRSTVRTDVTWERHCGPALDLFYSTCVAAWLCDMLDDRWFGGDPVVRNGYGHPAGWYGKHQGILSCAELRDAAAGAVKARDAVTEAGKRLTERREWAEQHPGNDWVARDLAPAEEALGERRKELCAAMVTLRSEIGDGADDYAQLVDGRWADAVAEAQAEITRRKRHADARKALADLPQLFIAV